MQILEQNLSQDNPKSIINQALNPFNNPNNFPSYATPNQINMFPNLQNPMNNNLPPGMTPQIPFPFVFQILPSGLPPIKPNKSNKEKQLQQQINELEELLQEQEDEYKEKIKKEKKSSQKITDNFNCIIEELHEEIQYQKKYIQQLQLENNNKNQIIDKISKEKIEIEQQKNDLQDDVDGLRIQNQQQIKKAKEEIRQLKEEHNKQKQVQEDELNSVQRELDKEVKQVDKYHQYFMEARDEITKLQKVIQQKDEKIKQLEFQQMNVVDTLRQVNMEKQRMEDNIKQKDFEIEIINEQIKILKNELKFLKDLIQDSQNEKQIKLDQQLEQCIQWLNNKKQEDEQKIKQEIQQNELIRQEKLNRRIQELEDEIYDLKKLIQSLQFENNNKNQIIDKISREKIEIEQQKNDLQDDVDGLRTQNQQLIRKSIVTPTAYCYDQQLLQEYENQIRKAKEENRQLKEEHNKQKQVQEDELNSVQRELDKQVKQVDKEHQYFMEARDEITKLQQVIKQKDDKIKQLEFQQMNVVDTLRQVNMDKQRMEDHIKQKDFEIETINEQIKILKNELTLLKDLIQDSQNGKQIKLDLNKQYLQFEQQMQWLNNKKQEDEQKIKQEIQQNELIRKEKLEKERKKKQEMQKQAEQKKGNLLVIPRQKEDAMEALCKQGNFYKFEEQPNVKTVKTKFEVWRVEIKDEEFNKNIETIEKIQCPQDFSKFNEGTWNCLRTEKPFAFGRMKDVFLMKKLNVNSDELYVIKTPIGSQPYKTMNDALKECKSHLICQKLMKRFVAELQEKATEKEKNIKIPPVIYSDLLILEESKNSFWIAERFFKGEFVKYNNNYGYINEEHNLELNKFAQSFTYYTYFISNFNYMVSDVQGVGNYFTDPAINTHKGNFDETDMGEEGQMMYLVNYENKKALLTYNYLGLLDIYE